MISQRFIAEELTKTLRNSDTLRIEERIEAMDTFKTIRNAVNSCQAILSSDGEAAARKHLEKALGKIWTGAPSENFETLQQELEEIENFATLNLMVALTDTPKILAATTYKERKVVVADFGGGQIQAFYASKGRSGAEKDNFFPFDGVGPRFIPGKGIAERFEKDRFMSRDQFNHLGNAQFARISAVLETLREEFPQETPCATGRDLNNLISKDPNHPAQKSQQEYEEIKTQFQKTQTNGIWAQVEKTSGPEKLLQNIRTRMQALITSANKSLKLAETMRNEAAIRKEVPFEDALPHLEAIQKTKKKIIGEIRESLDVALAMP